MRITDGSCLRSEPSTLYARIVDGSRSKGRTIHAGGRYHGRFNIEGEPSTLYARIMEGSYLKHEPSHEAPRADEVCDGGISRRAENSEAPACGDGAHGAPSPVMGAGGGEIRTEGDCPKSTHQPVLPLTEHCRTPPQAAWYRLFGQPGGGCGENQKKQ